MVFDNDKEKVRILPIRALIPDTNIVRLALSNLPFIDPEALGAGIITSLKPYGHIGYAVLNIYQPRNIDFESKYQPLVHNLPWRTPRANDHREYMHLDNPSLYTTCDAGFYATWNMHTRCTYCHDKLGDRTASSCKLCPGFQTDVCWECHEVGHKKDACRSPKEAKKERLSTNHEANQQECQRSSRGRRRSSRSPDRNTTLYNYLANKLDYAKNKDAMDVEECVVSRDKNSNKDVKRL